MSLDCATDVDTQVMVPTLSKPSGHRWMRQLPVRFWNWMLDTVSTVLCWIGVIGIAVWMSGIVFGTSVILFATGSMSPAIPQGSAVLSVATKAVDLHVGDVVTVDRGPDQLPISHRITHIEKVPGQPDARSITIRGDANNFEDSDPYVVTSVPRVVLIAPYAAYVLEVLADPRMTIAIGITVVLLILRAFGLDSIRNLFRRRAKT